MEFIVAVDENWGIGKDGGMLDHLPKDLAFFKRKTTGHVIVMGRKTLESFPGGKPLPDRLNIVLTQQVEFDAPEGVVQVHSLPELARTLRALGRDDVYLVGGASVYDDRWELAETIAHAEDQDKALDFCYYRNLSPQPLEAML